MSDNHLVIMAGGVGSRLWPISTATEPKQFIDVLGIGQSLLQMTYERFKGIIPKENVWIVTSKDYAARVVQQLPEVPQGNILVEPCRRNTAPCIALVSSKIRSNHPDANIVFTPSDHVVIDTASFKETIAKGLEFTACGHSVLTLGIKPSRPETGYGYIKSGESGEGILKVDSFKEKPDMETAERYLSEGGYYWNSGIFIWNVQTVAEAFGKHAPAISAIMDRISPYFNTDREQEAVEKYFPDCESISIDYAIMEKSDNVYVLPSDFGWSDLGTWSSLYGQSDHDREGNASVGENVRMIDCRNCMVHVPESRKVIVQGLDSYIVAESRNQLLICRIEDEQKLRNWQ